MSDLSRSTGGALRDSASTLTPTSQRPTVVSPITARQPDALDPQIIAASFQHLEIIQVLGRGGMGIVYQARQLSLDRMVALKVLPHELANEEVFRERFRREARALARLSHPNIVTVHDLGDVEGHFFFIMEFVDGLSLRHELRRGRLSQERLLAIMGQTCEAMAYAHEEGVVHRDLKPENILLDRKGRVRVADFGIAKLLAAAPGESHLTVSQHAMGTPVYMAPEQVERPDSVDHRADIYALGVILYEMLTSELPLGLFDPPSKCADVDVRFDSVIQRSLDKHPANRYSTVEELHRDIQAISGSPIQAVSRNSGFSEWQVSAVTETKGSSAEAPGSASVWGSRSAAREASTGAAGNAWQKPSKPTLFRARPQPTPAELLLVQQAVEPVRSIAHALSLASLCVFASSIIVIAAWALMPASDILSIFAAIQAAAAVCAMIIFVAARFTQQMNMYALAIIASILAMIPLSAASLIAAPLGAWAFSTLRSASIRRAFSIRRQMLIDWD